MQQVLGYVRVSSDSQLDGYGLDAQEAAIRSWVSKGQCQVQRIVSDVGVSGATEALDRPGLSEVLNTIVTGGASGLVVARLDRLARALTVQEATLAFVWRAGGDVFSADSGKILQDDPDDPMRTALRQVCGVFAELDRRLVTKRLRDGRVAKAATGRHAVGSYPFGYAAGGRGRTRDAEPHEREQAVVRVIMRLRASGLSYRQIAAELDDRELRPRRSDCWSAMSVRNVVLKHHASSMPAAPDGDD